MSSEFTYKTNLKLPKHTTVYNNINHLFNGNYLIYLNTIRSTHPYLLELCALLRKYQYYFQSLTINNTVYAFNSAAFATDTLHLLNLKSTLSQTTLNAVELVVDILPKFKKNEISFNIPNDLLRVKLSFQVECKVNVENDNDITLLIVVGSSCIELVNLKGVISEEKYTMLNKVVNMIFDVYVKEQHEKEQQCFKIVNLFLNHVENYLPQVFSKGKDKERNEWTQEEQDKLEMLLLKYKNEKEVKDKMKKIAEEIQTKTVKQVTMRYKELILKIKDKENKENKTEGEKVLSASNETSIMGVNDNKQTEKEVKDILKETNVVNTTTTITTTTTSNITVPTSSTTINTKNSDKDKDDNTKRAPIENFETTDDIIDEIIRVYNMNYKHKNLITMQLEYDSDPNHPQVTSITTTPSTTETPITEENDDDLSESSSEHSDSNSNNNADDPNIDDYSLQRKKNDELISIYLSTSLQPNISVDDLSLLQNLLSLSPKYTLTLSNLTILGISLAEITQIKLIFKCAKCNKVSFESGYQRLNKKDTLFYMGTTCPRCDNEILSIFKSEYLHESNLTNAGTIYIHGATVFDFLPSTFTLSCMACQEQKNIKLRTGTLHYNDSSCRSCHKTMQFCIKNVQIEPCSISNVYFLEKTQIVYFTKFNYVIKDDIDLNNYVKKYDLKIKEGSPLPALGTCKHYKHSYRWFRFSCCNKLFPCDECHDEAIAGHKSEIAKTVLCGHCAFEQVVSKMCVKCGKSFTKNEAKQGFWEGGKGCRNKSKMSSKDSHKYTGSALKTVSRRKVKKQQQQQK